MSLACHHATLNHTSGAAIKVAPHRGVPGLAGPQYVTAEVSHELSQSSSWHAWRHVARRNVQRAVCDTPDPHPRSHRASHMGDPPTARMAHQVKGDIDGNATAAAPVAGQGTLCIVHQGVALQGRWGGIGVDPGLSKKKDIWPRASGSGGGNRCFHRARIMRKAPPGVQEQDVQATPARPTPNPLGAGTLQPCAAPCARG